MNGAESLVRSLVAGGIDTCFTNPGTSEMHMVAALEHTPEIRCLLTLFEGVATGAADGYAFLCLRRTCLHSARLPRRLSYSELIGTRDHRCALASRWSFAKSLQVPNPMQEENKVGSSGIKRDGLRSMVCGYSNQCRGTARADPFTLSRAVPACRTRRAGCHSQKGGTDEAI